MATHHTRAFKFEIIFVNYICIGLNWNKTLDFFPDACGYRSYLKCSWAIMKKDKSDIWLNYNIADNVQCKDDDSTLERYIKEAYTKRVMELLDEHLQPGERVLDIGCGVGKWVVYLVQKGINCVGVDSSEVAVEKARVTFWGYIARLVRTWGSVLVWGCSHLIFWWWASISLASEL